MAASARPQRSHHSLVLWGKKGKRPMCGVKESPRRCGHRTAGPAHASGLQQSSATRRAVAVALVARRRLVAAEARALLPAVASCRRNLALCPARLVRRRGGDPLLVVAGKRRSCSQPAPIKRRRSRAPRAPLPPRLAPGVCRFGDGSPACQRQRHTQSTSDVPSPQPLLK